MRGKYRIRLGKKAQKKIKEGIKEQTQRKRSIRLEERIRLLNAKIQGWINYFAIADCKGFLKTLDEQIRTRLRMCIWKSWKTVRNRNRQLQILGMKDWQAHLNSNTRKSYSRTAHSGILSKTLTNEYFNTIGLKEMSTLYLKWHV